MNTEMDGLHLGGDVVSSSGIGRRLNGHIGAVFQRYLPFDWAISTYLVVTMITVIIWGTELPHRWRIVILHLAFLAIVFCIVRSGNILDQKVE